MSTAEWNVSTDASEKPLAVSKASPPQLHRIKTVRNQQGISLRSAARRMEMTILEAESLEDETSNMLLSTLYRWQEALDIPVANLLVDEDDGLSEPVLKRARMIRIMKTATAILEKANNESTRRLATMLVGQLVELMPELEEVSPWHTIGQRRSGEEPGRLAENPISDDLVGGGNGIW